MLSILILEDNLGQQRKIKEIVNNRILINVTPRQYDAEIALTTGDPNAVIAYLQAHQDKIYLALLDIDLKTNLDGIDVAEQIKNLSIFNQIAFITADAEALKLTIQRRIAPLDYITKNNSIEGLTTRLQETIDTAYRGYINSLGDTSQQFLNYERVRGVIERLPLEQVLFLQTNSHKANWLSITSNDQIIECIGKLKDFAEKYPELVYISRDTLVNLSQVKSYNAKAGVVTLTSGQEFKVSFRRRSVFKKLLN